MPDTSIPQQWHDLWAAIKAEGLSAEQSALKLGQAVVAEIESAEPATPAR